MTELTTRQFILCSLFLTITSKLMSMPISMFNSAKNDAIFAILFGFMLEVITVLLITYVIKKYPGLNLMELLKKHFGSVFAYIIIILLYAFILFKLFFALEEIYIFFRELLYDYFSPIIYALAMFFVIGYLSFKGCRTIGRTLEILFPVIIIGLAITIISELEFLSFTKMLPYFKTGLLPSLQATAENAFYFGNALPLLFFVGKVKINDHFLSKVTGCYLGLVGFVLIFCFCFYDIFGYSTMLSIFALTDYSQYDPYILDLQRLNWLSTIVNITKLFCSTSILLYCLGQAGKMLTRVQSTFFPIIVSFALNFGLAKMLHYNLDLSRHLITGYISYATLGLMLVVTILCIILCAKRRRNEQNII